MHHFGFICEEKVFTVSDSISVPRDKRVLCPRQPKCHCQAAIISDLALRVLQVVSSLYCIVVIATTALFDSLNMNAGNEDLEDVSSKLRAIPEETEQASLGVFRTPVRRSARLRG